LEQGWVYVLVNPSIPGLVKVGRTTKTPAERALELSRATGVATAFVLVFEQEFADCVSAERDIHAALDRCGMRFKPNREFFFGPIPDIIRVILLYAAQNSDCLPAAFPESGVELLRQGDRHLTGEGDTLQDFAEALRYYRLAAQRGSLIAYERLGVIIADARRQLRGGRNKALTYLKAGARHGNYFCHCEIAMLALEEGHAANFIKAWDLFFAQRAAAFMSEAEAEGDRYPRALQRYIVGCFTLGITPGHISELKPQADALAHLLARSREAARNLPEHRRCLTLAMRWVARTLLHEPCQNDRGLVWSWLPGLRGRWRNAPA
jgi:TPR repeat protein